MKRRVISPDNGYLEKPYSKHYTWYQITESFHFKTGKETRIPPFLFNILMKILYRRSNGNTRNQRDLDWKIRNKASLSLTDD